MKSKKSPNKANQPATVIYRNRNREQLQREAENLKKSVANQKEELKNKNGQVKELKQQLRDAKRENKTLQKSFTTAFKLKDKKIVSLHSQIEKLKKSELNAKNIVTEEMETEMEKLRTGNINL